MPNTPVGAFVELLVKSQGLTLMLTDTAYGAHRPNGQRRCWHAIGAGSCAGPRDEEHKSRTVRGVDQEAGIASDRRARICANPIVHGGADWARSGRCLCREAVGEFPGSDDFLYINDKKSILRWAISV